MTKQTILFSLLFSAVAAFAQPVTFSFQNKTFAAGDTVEANFSVSNFTNISDFQFTLKWDTSTFNLLAAPLTFTGVIPGYGAGCWTYWGMPGYALKAGEMRTIYISNTGTTLANGTHVFTIRFKAKKSGTVCAALSLWFKSPVWPNAWTPTGYVPLTVTCVTPPPAVMPNAASERQQVQTRIYPNPFSDAVTVEAEQAGRLEVFDQSGRMVVNSDIQAGVNVVQIGGAAGVYVCQVVTSEGVKAFKVVKQ